MPPCCASCKHQKVMWDTFLCLPILTWLPKCLVYPTATVLVPTLLSFTGCLAKSYTWLACFLCDVSSYIYSVMMNIYSRSHTRLVFKISIAFFPLLCGGQETTCRSRCSPSTMWAVRLGDKGPYWLSHLSSLPRLGSEHPVRG